MHAIQNRTGSEENFTDIERTRECIIHLCSIPLASPKRAVDETYARARTTRHTRESHLHRRAGAAAHAAQRQLHPSESNVGLDRREHVPASICDGHGMREHIDPNGAWRTTNPTSHM